MPGTLGMAGFHDQTVRDIIFPSVGGNTIRLELTNAFGRSPLEVGRVTVAVAGLGAGAVAGNIHPVSFGGNVAVRIPAGEQVLSDPVGMQVSALQELAVSIYLPGRTGRATFHSEAQQVSWVSTAGDHTAEAGTNAFMIPTQSWYYLSGLDVRSSAAAGTLVAFGDSITDGVQSTVGGNDRWPNDLARRLDTVAGPTLVGRRRGDRRQPGARPRRSAAGPVREARFARDALDQPGVRDVIVLEGINDIGLSLGPRHRTPGSPRPRSSPDTEDLIAAGARPGRADIRRDPAAVPGRRLLLAGGRDHPRGGERLDPHQPRLQRRHRLRCGDARPGRPAAGSTPPTTPAITCTPTTPGTRPWPTPSTWTCCYPRRGSARQHRRGLD